MPDPNQNDMTLLEEFCAAEPAPSPAWLARSRAELGAGIRAVGPPWGRAPRRAPAWLRRPGPLPGKAWVTPLAAAAAVIVAVSVPLTVSFGHGTPAAIPAGSGTAGAGTVALPHSVPPYYMVAPGTAKSDYADIDATATGKPVARINAPAGTITVVPECASANDRIFLYDVITNVRGPGTQWLARFNPATRKVTTTKLPANHVQPSAGVGSMSLSPDGTEAGYTGLNASQQGYLITFNVVDLATGATRTWSRPATKAESTPQLSTGSTWSADGKRLGFVWTSRAGNPQHVNMYTDWLTVASPGTQPPAPHEAPAPPSSIRNLIALMDEAPNGDVFLVVGRLQGKTWRLYEYSPSTQRYARLFGPVSQTFRLIGPAWASNDGQTAIVLGRAGGLGVVSRGHYYPLPLNSLLRDAPGDYPVW